MRLLLDTHIFLGFLDDESRLPEPARVAIHDADNVVLVSAAAIWEIAIKVTIGRLEMKASDIRRLPSLVDASGFEELPIRARHSAAVHGLPLHHRDPFDRLMIAQARTENLTLVSIDPVMRRYDVRLL